MQELHLNRTDNNNYTKLDRLIWYVPRQSDSMYNIDLFKVDQKILNCLRVRIVLTDLHKIL